VTGAELATDALGDAKDATEKLAAGGGIEARVGYAAALAQIAVATELRALREAQDTANLIAWYGPGGNEQPNSQTIEVIQSRLVF
jgi:hypothetical protein